MRETYSMQINLAKCKLQVDGVELKNFYFQTNQNSVSCLDQSKSKRPFKFMVDLKVFL